MAPEQTSLALAFRTRMWSGFLFGCGGDSFKKNKDVIGTLVLKVDKQMQTFPNLWWLKMQRGVLRGQDAVDYLQYSL